MHRLRRREVLRGRRVGLHGLRRGHLREHIKLNLLLELYGGYRLDNRPPSLRRLRRRILCGLGRLVRMHGLRCGRIHHGLGRRLLLELPPRDLHRGPGKRFSVGLLHLSPPTPSYSLPHCSPFVWDLKPAHKVMLRVRIAQVRRLRHRLLLLDHGRGLLGVRGGQVRGVAWRGYLRRLRRGHLQSEIGGGELHELPLGHLPRRHGRHDQLDVNTSTYQTYQPTQLRRRP